MRNHLIIMAGGIGSRFWPKSTPECPKQFIDISGCGKTMIQQTLKRFEGIIPAENVWVVTSKRYATLVKEQLPMISDSQILQEPCMRNTAPCIAYVTWKIKQYSPDANLIITPSDHIVEDIIEFQNVIRKGLRFVNEGDRILTLGMEASRPEIGYGYIQGGSLPDFPKEKDSEIEPLKIASFQEKPDLKTAQRYLEDGGYFWNAGIFLWNIKTIESAFRKYASEIASIFDHLSPAFFTDMEQYLIDELFPTCPSISIDYAIMEKADNTYVLPSNFGWSDLGTWGSLHELVAVDNNAVIGDQVRLIESSNCMVHVPHGKKVVLQGLDGFIVVEHNGVLMICKMEEEQRIKEFCKE